MWRPWTPHAGPHHQASEQAARNQVDDREDHPAMISNLPAAEARSSNRAPQVRVGPLAGDQTTVPGQQSPSGNQPTGMQRYREQPGQCRQDRPVGPVRPGPGHLAAQHCPARRPRRGRQLPLKAPRSPLFQIGDPSVERRLHAARDAHGSLAFLLLQRLVPSSADRDALRRFGPSP